MPDQSPRSIRYVRAQVERPAPDRCAVVVEIAGPGAHERTGRAEGGTAPLEMLRTVARAAADAVSAGQAGAGTAVRVRGILQVEAFGQVVIIVSLAATRGGKSQKLLGVCDGSDDLARAAALAVLYATNPILGDG